MVPYYGDFTEDATVYVMFNTFTSNDPSASSTITEFINTDVHIHKNDGLTQRNNAAGITVSKDFDGITGSHMIKIDTNDDTVGGFWVAGADYFVRIEGTVVDGATINATVAHFSIENRFNEVNVTKILGHLLTQTGTQVADAFQKFFDVATPTGTVNSFPDAAPDAAGGLPTTTKITDARLSVLTDWIQDGRLDSILDIIAADTTTDIPALIAALATSAQQTILVNNVDNRKSLLLSTLMDSCVTHFKMDDNAASTVVIDEKGTNGVWQHGNTTDHKDADGIIGTALAFDGSNDYINCGQDYQATFQDSFTINLWCKLADGQAAIIQSLVGNYTGITGNYETWIEVLTDGKVTSGIKTGALSLLYATEDTASFSNGATPWMMITVVANKLSATTGNMLIYINGELAKTSATQNFTWADYAPPNNLWIGNGVPGFMTGSVDEFTVFNKAATSAEIAALYNPTTLDEMVEDSKTLRQIMRYVAAFSAGKTSGGNTDTLIYRNLADTLDRLTVTADVAGNRSTVVKDDS